MISVWALSFGKVLSYPCYGFVSWICRFAVYMSLLGAQAAFADGTQYKPTALEITKLPKFCWGQFNPSFKGKGPTYDIYQMPNCEIGINHFCPGIVALNRAKGAVANRERRSYWLSVADGEFQYTVRAQKSYPACGLHPHLTRSLSEWRSLRLTLK
ncbi:MAG: hypothetical protein ACKVQA_16080 [Burkholderiales bacterium]